MEPGEDAKINASPSAWSIAAELFARLCALLALGLFADFAVQNAKHHPDAIAWLQLVDQSLNVLFLVIARWPRAVDRRPAIVLLAAVTTFAPLAIDHAHVLMLVPRPLTYGLQIAGITLQIFAKLSLGRSFGLLPANRGVKTGGAYRFIRHPMYTGYIVAQLGVLLGLASRRNLIVIGAVYALLGLRAFLEERLLARDAGYREYQTRVRWRLIPFVY